MSTISPTTSPVAEKEEALDPQGIQPQGAEEDADIVDLYSGKELNETDALEFARSKCVSWIVVAGHVDCGKTTLLTSLYELLQWGPVAEFNFAGSCTLPALEQRCHLARAASEAEVPDTQRTRFVDLVPTYLHLSLRADDASKRRVDFLFTDVSGEMFEHVRDSTDECQELKFLRRAAHFLLLLDSEKAVRIDKRWAMVEEAKAVLQSCIYSSMIPTDCVVTVAWSKFDYFAANDTDEHKAFRAEVVKQYTDVFGSQLPYLRFGEVAARPRKAPALSFGNGVPGLLSSWTHDGIRAEGMALLPELPLGTRESEKFGERHISSTTNL